MKITMENACDLHIHSAPDLGERIGNDVEIARNCRDAGMRAIGLKCHLDTTMGRAYYTEQIVGGIKVYGGLVLNMQCGGINPAAVDAALKFGAKLIWMPTFHSAYQVECTGKPGMFDASAGFPFRPVTILKEDGSLKEETLIICELVKKHNAILCTSHLSPGECLKLAGAAREIGLERLVITHPFFTPPAFRVEELKQACALGAFVEFSTNCLSPLPKPIDVHLYKEAVDAVGAERIIIGSDAGSPRKGFPAESIRAFAFTLGMLGVSEKDLHKMMVSNYDKLL